MLLVVCDPGRKLPIYAVKQKDREVREQEDWLSTGRNGRRERISESLQTKDSEPWWRKA